MHPQPFNFNGPDSQLDIVSAKFGRFEVDLNFVSKVLGTGVQLYPAEK